MCGWGAGGGEKEGSIWKGGKFMKWKNILTSMHTCIHIMCLCKLTSTYSETSTSIRLYSSSSGFIVCIAAVSEMGGNLRVVISMFPFTKVG